MDRLIPVLRAIRLPGNISTAARAHWAAPLAEFVETMASMLTVASARKTGRLPSFRVASNEIITAICTEAPEFEPEPTSLVFDRRFVTQMLLVWDSHTHREPEDASTYLHINGDEFVLGIAPRNLVDAIGRGDSDALRTSLHTAERVTGIRHCGV